MLTANEAQQIQQQALEDTDIINGHIRDTALPLIEDDIKNAAQRGLRQAFISYREKAKGTNPHSLSHLKIWLGECMMYSPYGEEQTTNAKLIVEGLQNEPYLFDVAYTTTGLKVAW